MIAATFARMLDHLFYAPLAASADVVKMDDDESRHLKAFRMKDGDRVSITDGRGTLALGTIAWHKHVAEVTIDERSFHQDTIAPLTLLVAPTKNTDRFEYMVEKAVEWGVHRIVPIVCENSERAHLRGDRLLRVALAALKQSSKLYLPHIAEPTPFKTVLNDHKEVPLYIAHCHGGIERVALQKAMKPGAAAILIGPEGDFSRDEIEAALQNGAQSVHLGPARLRTETAALSAAHTHYLLNQC